MNKGIVATQATDVLFARKVREEVREELRNRFLPSMLAFLNDEIDVVESIAGECSDEFQKVQLMRLGEDIRVVRQAIESMTITATALLQDR